MMPPLPKQNKTKEADFALQFRKWWTLHPFAGEFEIKYARNGSLAFSQLSHEQEVIGLAAISNQGMFVRRSSGTIGGADYSGLVRSPYWIVVKFEKHFYVISLKDFIQEEKTSKRRSLTEKRALEISVKLTYPHTP